VPHVAVDLNPIFGVIDRYAPTIEAAVSQLEASTGRAPVIVAHSMGGLAVRAWVARFTAAERVHRLVTIGTPHRGAWLARYALSRNTVDMRVGSAWIEGLEQAETRPGAKLDPRRCTCFFSHCDNVVFPASTATLPGADNRHIAGSAHVHLAFMPEVFGAALRLVDAADLH
jgi:triacylglycerol lipase